MGKPMVMGRKTYLSIGKPLPGRTSIVVTRDPSFNVPGVVTATSLEAAMTAARGDALRRGADAIPVIGGTDIFTQTMPLADRLEITHVHSRPEGDVSFPPIEEAQWRAISTGGRPRCGTQRFQALEDSAFPWIITTGSGVSHGSPNQWSS